MSSAFYSLYELQCELIHHYSPNTDNWTISRKKSNLNKDKIVLHEKIIIESSIKTIGQERKVALSCLTLCDPMDCSLPGSSVHGIFQARILEWIAISFSRGSSWPRDRTQVSRIVERCFTVWATREGIKKKKKNRTCSLITVLYTVAPIWIFSQTFITESRDCVCVLSHIWLFVTPMDCSPPGSSAWDFPGKNTGAGCHFPIQGIFPIQGLNLHHSRDYWT